MSRRAWTLPVLGAATLVAALFASVPVAGGQVPQAAGNNADRMPVVVVLHSYHHGYTWTDNISDGIRAVFTQRDEPVELRFEFLDARRIATEEYFDDLRRLLLTKYSEIDIDVVICADDQAMHFLLGAGAEIF